MESIKLPNGPTVDFYTVAEKKPAPNERVIFIVDYSRQSFYGMFHGRYATFKTAPGRFVSETNGSHKENTVVYWAEAYPQKI